MQIGFFIFFNLILDGSFLVDKESLTLIDDDYQITSREGQNKSVSLREYINGTTDIEKRNGGKKIINFFLLMFYFLAYKNLKNGFWKFHRVKAMIL